MKQVTIPARDQFNLSGRVYEADPKRVWIIHSATAVSQKFYAPFAEEMAKRGATVITYDYRGICDSRPKNIPFKKFSATMIDWAKLDAEGVHDWAQREFPGAEFSVIGHSFGGQILGMLENGRAIRRALFVASQMGYWRYFALKNQPSMIFYWYFLFPFFLVTLGYVPMKILGAGEDLPGGVARQWRNWCVRPDYLFSELDQAAKAAYKSFPAPILAYSFSDDAFAGGQAVARLLDRYPKAGTTLRAISPKDLGLDTVGHFGFFRAKFRENLWQEAWNWLADGLIP